MEEHLNGVCLKIKSFVIGYIYSNFMRKVLVLLIIATSGLASGQTLLPASNPYLKIKSISTCWHTESSSSGSGWYPAITVKFTPKRTLEDVRISGTFVDTKTSDSLGPGFDGLSNLEAGVNYSLEMNAEKGWYTPSKRKVRIAPIISINTLDGRFEQYKFKLKTMDNFSSNIPECGAN